MKKKLSYILIGIVIIIGGYLLVSEYQKKQIVKEAQKKVEIFFLYRNYEDISEVAVNKENYQFSPLGGLSIGGHVNGKKELFFNIMFDASDGQVGKVMSVFSPKDFPTEKEECKDNFCQ